MGITQKHIADALNLSVITVSRALREHPDLSISTRNRVMEKARELGYGKMIKPVVSFSVPTVPKRVGILFFDQHIPHRDPLASGVKRSIFLALQRECQRLQVETLIETVSDNNVPLLIKNGTIQAAFLFGRYTKESVAYLRRVAALAVSSFIDCPGLPRIVADNLNGMRIVTEHLVQLGHRRILFVGQKDPHTRIFEERTDGYLSAMYRHGLVPQTHFLPEGELSPDLSLVRGYSALVCASDSIAYATSDRLSAAGWKLPDDCSIAGFDDLAADVPNRVTTYAPDWSFMGKMAAELLLSSPLDIRGKDISVTVPGHLIPRPSTAPVAEPLASAVLGSRE